ncbi:MAG: hypothetical protein HWD58_10885 [Bacteroidota bacterium]|nr:MAG: hypothetical protein HWD58_10885 [Bacteroidota bacterium]
MYNAPSATMFWTTGNASLNPLLQVSDTATIQGTVQVTFINGFNPQPSDSIRLLQAGILQAFVNDTIYPSGYSGSLIYQNGSLNLTNINPLPCESNSENWLTICEDELPLPGMV